MAADAQMISLFSAAQARRLTGLSKRQLGYWDATDFFSPTHRASAGERFGRVYTFQDIVALRLIAVMRKRVALQELRRVGQWLAGHRESWSGRRFWIGGRRVFWDDDTGRRIGSRVPVQGEMPIEMDAVEQNALAAVAELRTRQASYVGVVERRRFTVGNAPRLAGTRIPTRTVWRMHRAGHPDEEIRAEFPQLAAADIAAALAWEAGQKAG